MQGSRSLIDNTESKAQQLEYSESIEHNVLKGMTLGNKANLEDSEDFAREVLANSATFANVRVDSAELDKILHTNFGDLSVKYQELGGISAEAFSIDSISSMSSGDLTKDSFGLISSTSDMFKDGKITSSEIAQVSVSAAKTAGSVVAMYTGTLATGPLGAIAAIPLAAVNFLQAEIDEQEALEKAAREYARKVIAEESRLVNQELSNARALYVQQREYVWRGADRVVAELSDLWYKCERDLGVYFDLRFFPGESPPPKGGMWQYPFVNGDPCVRAPTPVGGQLYFPSPEFGQSASAFDKDLKSRNYVRSPCSTDPFVAKKIIEPKYNYSGYKFYAKTVRALNALLPLKDQSSFWAPEGAAERVTIAPWKDYESIVYDWYYTESRKSNQTPPATAKRAIEMHESWIAAYAKAESQGKNYPAPPSIATHARSYITQQFAELAVEGDHLNNFKLRVFCDIVQTASAVNAEIAAAKALRAKGVFDVPITQMTQADKRSISLGAQVKSDPANLFLFAGAAAAMFGGVSYWRRRAR